MPWIVPSHQAPAVLLKLWKPRWFSGLALCLGSMAPDLENIFRLAQREWFGHTLAAQVYFTVPLTLVLHRLTTTLVFPWLLPRVPSGPPLYPRHLAAIRPAASLREWVVIAYSGMLGGLSHKLLDGLTHSDTWATELWPVLKRGIAFPGGPIPLHDALQVWLSLGLGMVAFWALQRIARRQSIPEEGRAWGSPEAQQGLAYGLVVCAAAGFLAGVKVTGAEAPASALELGAYGSVIFATTWIVYAAARHRLQAARASEPGEAAMDDREREGGPQPGP